ncbi:hypothetical protein LIER_26583 [Lithospermum erythrorhizon]|uniref:Uncharacterized protein n=1 Tax=Lithospermum erythrorhizon TaxID=34254 RepID=A0AAV3RER2_LITER
MERGATSQPGMTSRARSGAIPLTSRGTLPQYLRRPKTREHDQPKEIGDKFPRERHPEIIQEKFDESKNENLGLSTSRRPRKKRLSRYAILN